LFVVPDSEYNLLTGRPITAAPSSSDRGSQRGLVALALPTAFLASLLLLAGLASSASAGDRVYWANDGADLANRISFANLDGSGGGNLDTTGAPGGHPRGVAMDLAAGRVYWTKPGASPLDGRISFASLDGSGGGDNLFTGAATVNHPNAAAVYPEARRIYWANEFGNTISFANLDGSGGGDLIATEAPVGPMVDPGSGKIYWGNANPVNRISVANLDGSGVRAINTTGATLNNPKGVAIDPVTNRIYWANIGTIANPVNIISWASLDGSGGGNLNTGGATVNVPAGVAVDPFARRIYWGNQAANKISYANLDGSGGGDLNTGAAALNGSRSPVLLKAPSGVGAPTITGGTGPRSVLTCSQGAWASDLPGSWLYRAPQTLAYSWTRNGAAITGANGNTYTASAGGDHRCTVTASNPAGGTSQSSAAHAVSAPAGGSSKPGAGKRAFGAKTLVTMRVSARRISASAPIKVVIRNRNSFRVSGKLSVAGMRSARTSKRASVSRAFLVGAKARNSLTVKLSKSLRKRLKREGKLSLRLTARVKDPSGNTRTLRKNISLRLKSA
jgi:hypothetical protein